MPGNCTCGSLTAVTRGPAGRMRKSAMAEMRTQATFVTTEGHAPWKAPLTIKAQAPRRLAVWKRLPAFNQPMETPKYAPSIATAPAQPATSHSSSIYGGLSEAVPTGSRLDGVLVMRGAPVSLRGGRTDRHFKCWALPRHCFTCGSLSSENRLERTIAGSEAEVPGEVIKRKAAFSIEAYGRRWTSLFMAPVRTGKGLKQDAFRHPDC